MPQVTLIVEGGCPNIAEARARLRQAFAAVGEPPRWEERDVGAETCPLELRKYGSPTVLVDGEDVGGERDSADAACCRVYASTDGKLAGAPPVDAIVEALRQAGIGSSGTPKRSIGFIAALPTIGAALLPKLTCPLCWPAYASLLGAMGVGFVDYTPYLPAIMAALLALSLSSLAYLARRRRTVVPLFGGIVGAIALWLGRFVLDSDALTYTAIGLLALAPWIPTRRPKSTACPDCVPDVIREAIK
jgi:mercuric ion transport protein